jgi:hypothetical protein
VKCQSFAGKVVAEEEAQVEKEPRLLQGYTASTRLVRVNRAMSGWFVERGGCSGRRLHKIREACVRMRWLCEERRREANDGE